MTCLLFRTSTFVHRVYLHSNLFYLSIHAFRCMAGGRDSEGKQTTRGKKSIFSPGCLCLCVREGGRWGIDPGRCGKVEFALKPDRRGRYHVSRGNWRSAVWNRRQRFYLFKTIYSQTMGSNWHNKMACKLKIEGKILYHGVAVFVIFRKKNICLSCFNFITKMETIIMQ